MLVFCRGDAISDIDRQAGQEQGNWQRGQLAALASGALYLFISLAPLIEMDKTRTNDPDGMMLVGLLSLGLLIYFNWRVKRSE